MGQERGALYTKYGICRERAANSGGTVKVFPEDIRDSFWNLLENFLRFRALRFCLFLGLSSKNTNFMTAKN